MRLIHFSKNLPANFKIFLSNFENCKFCQRVGLAPLRVGDSSQRSGEIVKKSQIVPLNWIINYYYQQWRLRDLQSAWEVRIMVNE